MRHALEAKYIGCMIGSALGDSIGELAFGSPDKRKLLAAIADSEVLRYTDDTAMAIGLAQSLIEKGDVDSEHVGNKFHENYLKEPWRGYASGTPTVFALVESTGIPHVEAAKTLFNGNGSFGNGAAMRVAPVGLFYHGSPRLIENAFASAEVTHSHIMAKHGAALQASAIDQALALDPGELFPVRQFIDGLLGLGLTSKLHEKIEAVQVLLENHIPCAQAIKVLGKSVAIHESLPFSIYAFLLHPKSFEECLFCAVMNGGDRDTLGAMAGAISGAYVGIDGIPGEWRERLENRDLLYGLALSLLEAHRSDKSLQLSIMQDPKSGMKK
ncbi:MAG: ADP-ribosylglycohydrolase family protein [Syntrophobacteraceae bacterium]